MIDLSRISINRVIIHEVLKKKDHEDQSGTRLNSQVIGLDKSAKDVLRKRIVDATGRDSRAFELSLAKFEAGSFFHLVNGLGKKSETKFIAISQEIASLLAQYQRSKNINHSYLLLIDAKHPEFNSLQIVIKAEPHEALILDEGENALSVLEKVFLSPSQKLYKIGVLYRKVPPAGKEDGKIDPADWGCFLFDDQFRTDKQPAAYFYEDFLGFSVDDNGKIQTQRFFDKTEKFIKDNKELEENKKIELLSALKSEVISNQENLIAPDAFSQLFMSFDEDFHDAYEREVVRELPAAIVKEQSLIKSRLERRKIQFYGKVNLIGPESEFDRVVSIIDSDEELADLDPNDPHYTIIKVVGRPYSSEK